MAMASKTSARLSAGGEVSVSSAVALLQEAAAAVCDLDGDDENDDEHLESGTVSAAVRLVAENLAHPSIDVTEALIELFALYPKSVVPYVADIISSQTQQVDMVFAAYREVLAGDRSLLVPIAASLADLPLSGPQVSEFRATLDYALSTVDEDDLPAVVRAVLRASMPASQTWAATSIRKHTAEISPPIFTLVAEVVRDMARLSLPVARAFLKPPTLPSAVLTPIDVVVWAAALESYRDGPLATASISSSCAFGTLRPDIVAPLLEKYSQALVTSAEGLRRVALVVLDANTKPPQSDLACTLYRQLVLSFPQLRVDLISDLVCSNVRASHVALLTLATDSETAAIVGSNAHLLEEPLHRPQTLDTERHFLLCSAMTAATSHRPDLCPGLFILIRKQLLFGDKKDQIAAVSFARQLLPQLEGSPEFSELLWLLDKSVPVPVGDLATTEYLNLLSYSSSLMSSEMASQLWSTRLSQWIPSRLFTEGQGHFLVDLGHLPSLPSINSAVALLSACIGVGLTRSFVGQKRSVLEVSVRVPRQAQQLCESTGLNTRLNDRQAEENTDKALASISRSKVSEVHYRVTVGCSLVAELINIAVLLDDSGRHTMNMDTQGMLVAKVLEWSKLYAASTMLAESCHSGNVGLCSLPSPPSVKIVLSSLKDSEEASITAERLVLEKRLMDILVREVSRPVHNVLSVNAVSEQDFVEVLVCRLRVYTNNARSLRRQQSQANTQGDCWVSAALELRVENMLSLTHSVLLLLSKANPLMTKVALSKVLFLETGRAVAEFCRGLYCEALHSGIASLAIEVLSVAIVQFDDCYAPVVVSNLWLGSLKTLYELHGEGTLGVELCWPGHRYPSIRAAALSAKKRAGYADRYRLGALLCSLPVEEALIEAAGWTRTLDLTLQDRVEGHGDTSGSGRPCLSPSPLELMAEVVVDFVQHSIHTNSIVAADWTGTTATNVRCAQAGLQVVDGMISFFIRLAKTKEADLPRCLTLLGRILVSSKRLLRAVSEASNTPSCGSMDIEGGRVCFALALRISESTSSLAKQLKKRPARSDRKKGSIETKIAKILPRLSYNAQELLNTASLEAERYHMSIGDAPISIVHDPRYVIGCGVSAAELSLLGLADRETTLGVGSGSKTPASSRTRQ